MTLTAVQEAPTMTLTLTVIIRPDGSAFLPISGVAGALGTLPEYVHNRCKAHKVRIVEDGPDDLHGFEFAEGVRLIHKLQAEQDAHSTRWRRYVAHREEVKRAATAKRDAEMAAARQAERERQLTYAKRMEEQAARRAEEAAVQAAAERTKREGDVVEFERWAG